MLLDEVGQQQAEATAQRMSALPVAAVVSSPLERCQQTAKAIAESLAKPVEVQLDDRFIECGYGDWTGGELKKLAKDPLWKVVQGHPSAATFPAGSPSATCSGGR